MRGGRVGARVIACVAPDVLIIVLELAEAEAERIRLTAAADAERMQSESTILKQNPLLINKIVAEKLSDKLQIMMVPADGKFFMNDVLRNMTANNGAGQTGQTVCNLYD